MGHNAEYRGFEAGRMLSSSKRGSVAWLKARFPLGGELKTYTPRKFGSDLLSGLSVAFVSIPQALAFALIAGLPPTMVIMSVVVGGLVCGFFSSSWHMVFGPTNSISLLLATTVYTLGSTGLTAPELTVLLAFLIGVFQLTAGLIRFGRVTQFISRSVIIAYSTAIGVLLMISQLPHLLGIPIEHGMSLLDVIKRIILFVSFLDINFYELGTGVFTLMVYGAVRKIFPRLPGIMFSVVLVSFLVWVLKLDKTGVSLLQTDGGVLMGLPSFIGIPFVEGNLSLIPALLNAAVAIALVGILEAVLISKTLAAKSGQPLDTNQELIAMGMGNIANSLYGAMPGSASFARSAANYESGGKTQLAAMFSSGMVFGIIYFCLPLLSYIPIAALAAHLIKIGMSMIHPEQIRISVRATRADAVVFVVTFIAALVFKLDAAIYVGVGVSLVLFLAKAATPALVEYNFTPQGNLEILAEGEKRGNVAISILHVEGEMFFGAAELLQDQVRYVAKDSEIKVVILRMKNVRHLDATTVMSLLQLNDYLRRNGRFFLISGCKPDVYRALRRSGALAKIGAENVFRTEGNLAKSTKHALQRAKFLLDESGEDTSKEPDVRVFANKHEEDADEDSDSEDENA